MPKIEAKVTHRFTASPEQVYDAWLDPAQVRVWLAASLKTFGLPGDIRRVEIDPNVGGKFLFSDLRNGNEQRHWGTYLELVRPRKIVFTWIVDESGEADPSIVTLNIEPIDVGCVVNLAHLMDEKWSEFVKQTELGWSRMLSQIDEQLR